MSPGRACAKCGTIFGGVVCPKCPGGGLFSESESTRLKRGDRIGGFEILELIGAGGMGLVYKARQPSLDRVVALKVLRPERAFLPRFEDRFQREAKVLASLSHPGIVTIHDFGQEGERYYVVLEFVEGTTLRDVLPEKGLPPRQAVRTLLQVCDALHFAHEKGVVHRDVKPENILIDKSGRVKITDFGLAKLLGPSPKELMLTGSDARLGTVHYMAPEQVESAREVDRRADLYSLGVMAYEMFTGELPLGRFERPSKKSAIGLKADAVILKALEKDPSRRYESVAQFRDDLVRAMAEPRSGTARTAPTSATVDAKRPPRKLPIPLLAVGAVVVALAAVLLAVRPWRKKPAPQQAAPQSKEEDAILAALPGAAAMDFETWKRILAAPDSLPSPDGLANHSLTYLLLRQKEGPDIEWTARTWEAIRPRIERQGLITILHSDYVRDLAFSPDTGKGSCRFESGEYRGSVEFVAVRRGNAWHVTEFRCPKGSEVTLLGSDGKWRATWPKPRNEAWRLARTLERHSSDVWRMAFSPDGKRLATASRDMSVGLWSFPDGTLLGRLSHSEIVAGVAFRPDGTLVSVSRDGTLRIWDVERRAELHRFKGPEAGFSALALSPDGSFAIAGSDQLLVRYDLAGRSETARWKVSETTIVQLALSPDLKFLIVAGSVGEDPSIAFWDPATGTKLPTPNDLLPGIDARFSPDGRHLAIGTAGAHVWNWKTWTREHVLLGSGEATFSVAFSPDGGRLASVNDDRSVYLWDPETGRQVQRLGALGKEPRFLLFDRTGRYLLASEVGGAIQVWERAD